MLINNLRNHVNNILYSDADNSEIQPEWVNNVTELVEDINNSDPRRFLQWNVIRNTMFVPKTSSYIVNELKFLIEGNWHIWKSATEEVQIGHPDPCIFYPKSSSNLIHHAYHLAQLGNQLKLNITDIDYVLEFGGGYGSMCRLFHNLGFKGKYIIFDLPVFSALQEFYLKSIGINAKYGANEYTNGVSCIFKTEVLREILNNKESKKKSIFIATWSISETPIYAILSMLDNFDLFLIAYQKQFGEIDNSNFFSAWKDSLKNYKWYSYEIRHLPNNYYLFGKYIP
ncbi:MAG TPA: hypothetical protein ACFYD9_00020 [Candidatus Wunengus sp. YC64]|uniref:hypothetical protein n=1 Tax=Candidatus Wunengus sp. YC64 TaxID=3367700 RepID=UPI0040281FFB